MAGQAQAARQALPRRWATDWDWGDGTSAGSAADFSGDCGVDALDHRLWVLHATVTGR